MKKVNNKSIKLIALTILSLGVLLLLNSYKGSLEPNNYFSTSKNLVKDNIEGLYSLNTCEDGRFKIKIDNK